MYSNQEAGGKQTMNVSALDENGKPIDNYINLGLLGLHWARAHELIHESHKNTEPR
jgi:hypothetical protein